VKSLKPGAAPSGQFGQTGDEAAICPIAWFVFWPVSSGQVCVLLRARFWFRLYFESGLDKAHSEKGIEPFGATWRFELARGRINRDVGHAGAAPAQGIAAQAFGCSGFEIVPDDPRAEDSAHSDQRRAVFDPGIGVVNHHRFAALQRALDQRHLPVLAALSIAQQVLADQDVGIGKPGPVKAALTRSLQARKDDELHRQFDSSALPQGEHGPHGLPRRSPAAPQHDRCAAGSKSNNNMARNRALRAAHVAAEETMPVAIITGAGRGIGRATAEAFAAESYAVVIAELRAALGRRAERELEKKGRIAVFLHTDVTDPASVARCVRSTLRRFGRVDCLVNNAGVLRVGTLVDLTVRETDRMLAVNLRGPLLMSKAVLPAMLRRRAGSIVNLSSLLGKSGAGQYVPYCASKFGVVGLTEALADELAGTGIRVWAVCPGLVDTPMARKTGISSSERRNALKPDEVASVIVSLATGRRRAVSGRAVDVT
jgi:3-oxoacyl-[acyl-carrier protein] reductase